MVTAICDGSVGRPDGFADSGLQMSLLIESFKKILHCHWLIFSKDSQREVFVNTALVFTSECLLFQTFTITSVLLRAISTSDIWNKVDT
jgi:hypothetical protein